MEDDELGLDDDLDNEGEPGSDAAASDGALPSDDESGSKESKRVNDLTSKWQKAEARAKKAEAALAKSKPESDAGAAPAVAPEVSEWIEAQREFARERALNSDPRLAEYGLTADDIAGDTPAEVKASVKRQIDLINSIETKVRQRLLIEHGLSPEVPGGGRTERLDIDGMSEKDFDQLVARSKNRL